MNTPLGYDIILKRSNLKALESIQRRATKYILGVHCDDTYKARLIKCNLHPLSYRREILDLVFLYKCLHGYYSVNLQDLFPLQTYTSELRNSNNTIRFEATRCGTETFRHSYVNRTIYRWNNLPHNIKASTTIGMFKSRLKQHYNNLRNNYFDDSNTCTWRSKCFCAKCRG